MSRSIDYYEKGFLFGWIKAKGDDDRISTSIRSIFYHYESMDRALVKIETILAAKWNTEAGMVAAIKKELAKLET